MNLKIIINEEINNLNEGLSNIVYHFTHINNLISILKSNKFATSSNLGSNADAWKDKGKFYFFSTQRTKGMSGYGSRHGTVAIVLDGNKLNYNFKGFPTDYWSKKRNDYNSLVDYTSALQSAELEDRIVTDKPYIDNANKYIIEIHIEAKDDNRNLINIEGVNEVVQLSQNLNIPIYFYKNKNDFKLQNKSKAVAPENLGVEPKEKDNAWDIGAEKREGYNVKWFFKKVAPIIIIGNDIDNDYNEERNTIDNLLKECLKKYQISDEYNKIIKDINNKVNQLSTFWGKIYIEDEYHSLAAEIHNNRGNPNPYFREILKMLVNDMKKWRKGNLKEYIEKKTNSKIRY